MLKVDEPSGKVLFEENQKFPKWLKMLILGIVTFTLVLTIVLSYVASEDKIDIWLGPGIAAVTEFFVFILFRKVRLEKTVTSNGFYYRWRPWQRKFRWIEKDQIVRTEVRPGPPFHYGIGWFPGYGTIHNASMGDGLQLYLMNGKKIFFSTFDIASFEKAFQQILSPDPKPRFSEY
jgi:hypothetical protein